jgi:hypothetical protein
LFESLRLRHMRALHYASELAMRCQKQRYYRPISAICPVRKPSERTTLPLDNAPKKRDRKRDARWRPDGEGERALSRIRKAMP